MRDPQIAREKLQRFVDEVEDQSTSPTRDHLAIPRDLAEFVANAFAAYLADGSVYKNRLTFARAFGITTKRRNRTKEREEGMVEAGRDIFDGRVHRKDSWPTPTDEHGGDRAELKRIYERHKDAVAQEMARELAKRLRGRGD